MRHGPLEPFSSNAIPRIDTFLDRLVGLGLLRSGLDATTMRPRHSDDLGKRYPAPIPAPGFDPLHLRPSHLSPMGQ